MVSAVTMLPCVVCAAPTPNTVIDAMAQVTRKETKAASGPQLFPLAVHSTCEHFKCEHVYNEALFSNLSQSPLLPLSLV